VAFALFVLVAHPKVESRLETTPGPQVEEHQRTFDARTEVVGREPPYEAVDDPVIAVRVAGGAGQKASPDQCFAGLIEG
jgi:hypothetical protein